MSDAPAPANAIRRDGTVLGFDVGARRIGVAVGSAFEAFAGCDRSFSTCQSKVGNALNFGGFPWIPAKNPLAGDSIV